MNGFCPQRRVFCAAARVARVARGVVWSAILICASAVPVHAQQPILAVTPTDTPANATALLAREVSIDVRGVTLHHAIDRVSESARVPIVYQSEVADRAAGPITLRLVRVPLSAALDSILKGTSLRVIALPGAQLGVVATHGAQATLGGIAGRITETGSGRSVRGATVVLDDSARWTVSDDKGHYQFANVRAGTHRVTVRQIGFILQSRLVTVADDQLTTANLALATAVNTLDQVVVTATGEQRIRELGHVVATINADSLVKAAPISNLVELLQSRVPGLQVFTGSGGVAGASASLRVRSATTGVLDKEPIVIVDGVRFKSSNMIVKPNGGSIYLTDDNPKRNGDSDVRSFLDDLNPNDIASVDVVKGPSASTLYGPDAANGVIVITTKRGQPGRTEFHWYARPVSNAVPVDRFKPTYQAYSHDPNTGDPFDSPCSLVYQYQYHVCVLDSIAPVPTLAGMPEYSVIAKQRPQWQYGASVSGGTQAVRYFLSGNYDSQIGALHLSPRVADGVEQLLGVKSLSDVIRNPNTLRNIGGHANVVADFGPQGSVSATVGYTQSYNRSLPVPSAQYTGIAAGTDTSALGNFFNVTSLVNTTEVQSGRFDGSITGAYRPVEWLNVTGTIGTDLAPSVLHSVLPRVGAIPDYMTYAQDVRRSNVGRTATTGATALARPGVVSLRSSVGVQYTYTHLDGVELYGSTLAPGSSLIQTASRQSTTQQWQEQVSLGTYGEEVIGFHDRLFVTGSLRIDGSTSFGDKYRPTPYPKVGLSWIVSDEPWAQRLPLLREFRLRSSYGAASRYPVSAMKMGIWAGGAQLADGVSQTTFTRTLLGNPLLRPERTAETEFGADLTLLSDIRVGLTWNRRRTADMLYQLPNAPGLLQTWVNVGTVSGHGFEATASAPLFSTPGMHGDLTLSYSHQSDKLVSLGGSFNPGAGSQFQLGYPLESVFGNTVVGVADTVGGGPDSIVFNSEIIYAGGVRYRGVTTPPSTFTAVPSITLLGNRLHVSALFDRQTGFVTHDGVSQYGLCIAGFIKGAPLLEQAKCLTYDDLERGDFTRWRELTFTYTIPERLLRIPLLHLAFSGATMSLQGRDLMLWTAFPGPDPESLNGAFPGSGWGLPQARTWSFRFDITP